MTRGDGDDGRDRVTGAVSRVAVIVISTVLGGMIAAVGVIGSEAVEPRLTENARDALRDAGISNIDVRFDGREAFLSGASASRDELARAERLVEAVDGVRWATVVQDAGAGTSAETALPALSVQSGPDGAIAVTGTVGTAQAASALQDAAETAFGEAAEVDMTVEDGVAAAGWSDGVPALFGALSVVDDLAFSLEGDHATLAGSAAVPTAVEDAVEGALPGVTLDSTLTVAAPTIEEVAAVNGTVVLFIADSITIDGVARATIAQVAEILRQYPGLRVQLTGHIAIPTGTPEDAIAFSTQRAQAVADELVALGIDASRLAVVGAGASDPVGDNATLDGAASNRRVTFLILEAN